MTFRQLSLLVVVRAATAVMTATAAAAPEVAGAELASPRRNSRLRNRVGCKKLAPEDDRSSPLRLHSRAPEGGQQEGLRADQRPGSHASEMTGQRHLTEPRSFKLPAGGMWGGMWGGMCGLKLLSEIMRKAITMSAEIYHLECCYGISGIVYSDWHSN